MDCLKRSGTSKRLKKTTSLSQAENNDNEENNFQLRSRSSSTNSSTFDDDDKDPTYEFSDSSTNNDVESSHDSFSDTELTLNNTISKKVCQDNTKTQSDLNEEAGPSNVDNPTIENLNSQSLIPNSVLHEKNQIIQDAKKVSSPPKEKKIGKKRTYCKFCEKDVTNFERHLERHHADCKEVQDMFKYEKKSLKRKNVIQTIRNEGNFTEYLRGKVRPVHQRKDNSGGPFYPCAHCKGLYNKNFLHRHYKKCIASKITGNRTKINHLSASQTVVACGLDANNVLHKLRVKEEVFNTMKADKISLVAKTDTLIFLTGEQYLKKHKRKQMATVCSNKMRELARLLIEIREIENNESIRLVDVIEPAMFDKVIECAKRVGGYNSEKKVYEKSASLAAHLGTSLKMVCDLVLYLIHSQKKSIVFDDPEAKSKSVERFKDLISSQWTTEISSLAFKDLNEKKWNKPTVLPLTQDILKFKNHVIQVANTAAESLKVNLNNQKEYKNLVSATLALTILYNRKRIGDVQYTKLSTYLHNFSSSNQDECINSLSQSEQILTKYYKRIVTGGKGSRAIVILFPQNLQDFMNVLVNVREKTNLVPKSNEYLFANPNSNQWIRGDTIIRKFAQKCNVSNPEHLSSNKLRKQIATVMQILSLTPEENEQFAQFMGHTEKTHNEYYKLQEDIYQTAKVSKLLILMDKGEGHKYKGKSLKEIDINPEIDEVDSEGSEDDEPKQLQSESVSKIMFDSPKPSTSGVKKSEKQTGRTAWSREQIEVVTQYFKTHIEQKKAPKKNECEELINRHPNLLKNKDWIRIKTYVYNTYRNK